jgi:hypothetical protein
MEVRVLLISLVAVTSSLAATFAGLFLLGEVAPEMQYETALPYLLLIFFAGLLLSALIANRWMPGRKH